MKRILALATLLGAALLGSHSSSDPAFADTTTLQQAAQSFTGLGAATVRNLDVQSTCTTTISGMVSGDVVNFEGAGNGVPNLSQSGPQLDTSTYFPINTTTFGGTSAVTTATANGLYVTPVAGLTSFRARISTNVGSTIGLTVTCSPAVLGSQGASSGAGSGPTPIPTPSGGIYPDQAQALVTGASSFTLSTACSTPTTPTSCASTSYKIFNLSNGGADYSYQIDAANSGTFAFYSSNDGVNFFASNLSYASGVQGLVTTESSTTTAGKFSGIGGSSNYVAIVATVAPSSAVTVYPYISQRMASVSIHAMPQMSGTVTVSHLGTSGASYVSTFPDTETTTSTITTATTTLVLSGTSNQTTFVFFAGTQSQGTNATSQVNMIAGTGSTCGTNTIYPFGPSGSDINTNNYGWTYLYAGADSANTGYTNVVPAAWPIPLPAGDNVCVVTSGTTINVKPFLLTATHS